MTNKLLAEIVSSTAEIDRKKTVDMTAAIDQVRKQAQRMGIVLTDVGSNDAHTVSFRIAEGPEVSLQWKDMGEDTVASRNDLDRRFGNLIAVVERTSEVKAPLRHVDLTQ